ncbi:glycerate kinase [uncultured Tessaracoccus sp.]|uniref:glycerate kinase n=1 Tax=uncultured Tessaracoccus sp. TaxID=905023 RepID=UPI0025E43BC7|nr:glycerate kinase [uncultured Tessaracoccus sp.]
MIICAPDSFKESMTAAAAARAMARGVRHAWPDADVALVPMADGGEGTCAALQAALGGHRRAVDCHDALGRPIRAEYLHVPDRRLACVEMAAAAGIELLTADERNPRVTSTFGVGELIRAALDEDVDELLIGLGGSATNDAGAGMLRALGARWVDERGAELSSGGAALADLAEVDLSGLDERLRTVRIVLASDVTNPLLGPRGASHVFGPQKGADPGVVAELDRVLARWADVVEHATGVAVRDQPGAGAAGGLGAAFMACTGASTRSGAEYVMEAAGIDELLRDADLVLTGEGSWDAQSAAGKAPAALAARAAAAGVPTVVFAGRVDAPPEQPLPDGVVAVVPVVQGVCTLDEALADGERNLERAVATALRLLRQGLAAG